MWYSVGDLQCDGARALAQQAYRDELGDTLREARQASHLTAGQHQPAHLQHETPETVWATDSRLGERGGASHQATYGRSKAQKHAAGLVVILHQL